MVSLSHRDYPYHDYHDIADTEEPETYVVGTNNRGLGGTQNKLFVSKSTLFYSGAICTFRLNSARNVLQTLPADLPIRFESNIQSVHIVTIGADGTLYMWFEGVLPQEARSPL